MPNELYSEQLRKLELENHDIIHIPVFLENQDYEALAKAIRDTGKKGIIFISGELNLLKEEDMNKIGWYRQPSSPV